MQPQSQPVTNAPAPITTVGVPTSGQGFQPYQYYQTTPNVAAVQQEGMRSQGSGLADYGAFAPVGLRAVNKFFPETVSAIKGSALEAVKGVAGAAGINFGTSGAASAAGASGFTTGGSLAATNLGVSAPTLTSTLGSGAAATGAAGAAGASMSMMLGAAGLGALGGYGISRLTGGNPVGSSIGGGGGALAGMAIGGPIGAIAGGVIGSVVGGLFGNKQPSNMSAGVGFNPFTGEVFSEGNKGTANIEGREQLRQNIVSSTDALQNILGFSDEAFRDPDKVKRLGLGVGIDVGSRDGVQYNFYQGQGAGKAQVGDLEGAETNIVKQLARNIESSGQFAIQDRVANVIRTSKATTTYGFLEELAQAAGLNEQQQAQTGSESAQTAIIADDAFEQFMKARA